ncbi:MAG: hypothetical protein A2Y15_06615 [Clostridiales bacterium GWF2_36_10]|nr:MAG: hypothetical protein A2Y15_06615 [Clostridiales bacterium GWF2_36_10]
MLLLTTLLICSCGLDNTSIKSSSDSNEAAVVNSGVDNTTESDIQSEVSETETTEKLRIVTLGDSITRGYGLDNPSLKCFPSQLANNLREIYGKVDIKNYAIDGLTSGGLLEQLKSGDVSSLKDADIVTVCIGANNVLHLAFELIGNGNTDVINLFMEYGKYLMGDKSNVKALDDLSDYFASINERAESSEFIVKVQAGVEDLRTDIPKIIEEIRKVNKDAKIYFSTIYSPYKGMNVSLALITTQFKLGYFSDNFVNLLNEVIIELSEETGYNVVDICTLFAEDVKDNVNAGIDIEEMNINFDPHPNLNGHTLIADEYTKIITEDNT